MVLRKRRRKEYDIQDILDELSRKNARRYVGGGHVNMAQDDRGLRGVILA